MRAEIIVGDCIDALREMRDASADACVMDPPYTAAGGSTNGRTSGADSQFFEYWLRAVLAEVRRVVRPAGCAFIFCDWRTVGVVASAMRTPGHRQTGREWAVSQALAWDRECIGLGAPFRNSFEMIAFAKGPDWSSALPKNIPTVIRHRWPYGQHRHHGAEKPVDLCRQLVRWALPSGGTVLDPFAGSGTVGVAALLEGCDYVGVEIEETDADVARRRIADALAQPSLEGFPDVA